MNRKVKGFTIIELLVVLAVLGITMTLAAPNMATMIADNRISSSVSDYVAAMQLAKTESASRITAVTLCAANATLTGCGGGSWRDGWIVFTDENADVAINGTDSILLSHEALDPRITFGGTGDAASFITYQPSGTSSIENVETMIMCDDRGFIPASRGVTVTITGRGNVTKASDTNLTSCI